MTSLEEGEDLPLHVPADSATGGVHDDGNLEGNVSHKGTSQRSVSKKSDSVPERRSMESAVKSQQSAVRGSEDSGGGGDTEGGHDIQSTKLKSQSLTSDAGKKISFEKSSRADLKGAGTPSQGSDKSTDEHFNEDGEDLPVKDMPDETASTKSESSGLKVVTQILTGLIDSVIKIKELESQDKKREETKDEKREEKKMLTQTSIITIKSADDQESVEMERESQDHLEQEQEEAALRQEQHHQNNITLFHSLIKERENLLQRNSLMIKFMYEHYKRRKIDHLFKDVPMPSVDFEGKYMKALFAFEAAKKEAEEEEQKMSKQVLMLDEKKASLESELEEEWNNLINREHEIAKGIPSVLFAKQVDKQPENMIQRQIAKAKEVTKVRLTYFKLRDIAAADENHLKSLENLGENLTLMEYEQLKMQSQSCVEKLEERDADLHRLRCKATAAIQILAEIREKIHTIQEEIEAGRVLLHDVNQELIQTRERVSSEKKRRDMSRSDTMRLRQEAGLLSEPKLLQDYKTSLLEKESLQEQLRNLKIRFESQKQYILNLRRESA